VSKRRDAFSAVADPTRRAILDLLRQRPSLTAGEIAAHFSHMSRPAISRHLGVLRDAGLVHARELGREWHYQLDPGPLGDIYEDWLARFAPLWEASLKQLKRQAEQPQPAAPGDKPGRRGVVRDLR
jgi:DNA-binding transcriptional ArsR family regulator